MEGAILSLLVPAESSPPIFPVGVRSEAPEERRMAGWTRLELATFCVTGRRSNQLSYHPVNL